MEQGGDRGVSVRTGVLVGVGAGSVAMLALVVLVTVVIWLAQVQAEVEGLKTRCERLSFEVGQASLSEYEAATRRLAESTSARALQGGQGCVDPAPVVPRASAGHTGSMSAKQWLQSAGQ